jgi:hypothetical protein
MYDFDLAGAEAASSLLVSRLRAFPFAEMIFANSYGWTALCSHTETSRRGVGRVAVADVAIVTGW